MVTYIGDVPLYYISAFSPDSSTRGIASVPHLHNEVPPSLGEFNKRINTFALSGTLLQDAGVTQDIDDMAESLIGLIGRAASFNYLDSLLSRSGWLSVGSVDSPRDAESIVTREYTIEGLFLPKALYQTRMHSVPRIRTNDFSFTLGVNDCDNYIAIPIGATYLGGDGSTITRTSKDGDITLVKATTSSDIKWDINEADQLNGECKIFDMMSENLLKNDDFEDWSDGASSAPDGWILSGGGGSIARSTDKKIGVYSAALSDVGGGQYIYQDLPVPTDYIGKTLSINSWAKSNTANAAFIKIEDNNGNSVSSYHSGGGSWELLNTTRTISSGISVIRIHCAIDQISTGYFDGVILVEGSEAPTTPVLDTYGVQVYLRDREFVGSMIIENGLYRILINPFTDHITIYYWDGSDYVHISAFTAGTFTRTTILENTPDCIRVKLDSDVDIELRRGHPPMIDTGTTDLITIGLTPSDQSTSTENYLSLGTNLYICSDESFSILNATKNLDDGKKWIFYETVSATAEDIAHQAMVDPRQVRELVGR